ncbi:MULTISPECIES: signal peptidase I [unclassified Ruminococcus]|uniref:signal peptidase I n=1 Tax=unclassified Ruminococcus TaxID=2608920 RepID=UPI00210D81B1|nr:MULTISPECIES: signal peptidase I [unclassified Ruminococcus]MCQ4023321.1 signal peptidase I [Ruminococcus sp. zg-924]MCQ4115688.1 signal peptidase I [Ruminococcus sp. zg-921]
MKKIKAFFKNQYVKSVIKSALVIILIASILLNIFTYIFSIVRHYGSSMQPALSDNQYLLIYKTADVDNGDVIAFYYNNKVLVRRVAATAGEQVYIDIFGNVSINGTELDEPYVSNKTLGQSDVEFPYTVPANSVFVLGDNRETSMDSRLEKIGAVSEDRIIGKVILPNV